MVRFQSALLALTLVVCGTRSADAIVFSLDPSSPSIGGPICPADLLAPGPAGSPPFVVLPFNCMGLVIGDDIDAVSFGPFQGNEAHFSVDRTSTGQNTTVIATEAAANQQAADIYSDLFPIQLDNVNSLTANQDALGLTPNLAAGTFNQGSQDNIDALDMDLASLADFNGDGIPDIPIYFSLAPGSPTLGILGSKPGDILVTQGGALPNIAVSHQTLLLTAQDDVDALLYDPGNVVPLISLTALSPSAAGFSGADVYSPTIPQGFLGPSLLAGTISTLGLLTTDELDAFSDRAVLPSTPPIVPEPGTLLLIIIAASTVTPRRRAAGR